MADTAKAITGRFHLKRYNKFDRSFEMTRFQQCILFFTKNDRFYQAQLHQTSYKIQAVIESAAFYYFIMQSFVSLRRMMYKRKVQINRLKTALNHSFSNQ